MECERLHGSLLVTPRSAREVPGHGGAALLAGCLRAASIAAREAHLGPNDRRSGEMITAVEKMITAVEKKADRSVQRVPTALCRTSQSNRNSQPIPWLPEPGRGHIPWFPELSRGHIPLFSRRFATIFRCSRQGAAFRRRRQPPRFWSQRLATPASSAPPAAVAQSRVPRVNCDGKRSAISPRRTHNGGAEIYSGLPPCLGASAVKSGRHRRLPSTP